MKCKNCGAEIPDNVAECPYCDTAIDTKERVQQRPVVEQEVVVKKVVETEVKPTVMHPLVGKKYSFKSARGARLTGFISSRYLSDIEIGEDRIKIMIKPKRFNTVPAIMLEDITDIDISKKIHAYYWIWIIISIIGVCCSQFYLLICTVIFILAGLDRKIIIAQRNGKNVIIYSHDKQLAETFKEDMKSITKIM